MQSIVHTVDGLADGAGGCGDASDTQPQQIQPEIHFKLGQEQLHLPAPADPAANAAPPAPPACSCFRHGGSTSPKWSCTCTCTSTLRSSAIEQSMDNAEQRQ